MLFRIAVNVGEVIIKDGDLFGDGINVTARLEGLVKGGEICVSRGVRDHLRHRGGMTFEDLGEQLVKNIAHPVRAFRLRVGDDTPDENIPAPDELPPFDEGVQTRESSSAAPRISEPSAESAVALELALWDSSRTVTRNWRLIWSSIRTVPSRRWPGHAWRQASASSSSAFCRVRRWCPVSASPGRRCLPRCAGLAAGPGRSA